MIKVGSIWRKRYDKWGSEGGDLVIVTCVESNEIQYRYWHDGFHGNASRTIDSFLDRLELVS